LHEAVDKFCNSLPDYLKHIGRVRHQYRQMKRLKDNLSEHDLAIHIDYSENYDCKYHREVASCHFGANKRQLTLHTGMAYRGQEKPHSFCTITEDPNHDAVAVWSHLRPILSQHTDIKTLHTLSDSPSSQYRNKNMFFIIISKIIPLLPNLSSFTWNFIESSHGKSAADGVGGCLKRTCNDVVASGARDILTLINSQNA